MSKLAFVESLSDDQLHHSASADEHDDEDMLIGRDSIGSSGQQQSTVAHAVQPNNEPIGSPDQTKIGKHISAAATDTMHVKTDDKFDESHVQSQPLMSQYLTKFLSKQRTFSVPEAPEIEPNRDTYLKLFNDTTEHPGSANEAEDSDDESNYMLPDDLGDVDAFDTGDLKFTLFNLPYAVTDQEVLVFVESNGFQVKRVEMSVDRNTGMPSGSAVVFLDDGYKTDASVAAKQNADEAGTSNIVDECVDALTGKRCGGRPVRPVNFSRPDNNRRRSGGGRYFELNLSQFCEICGQYGHVDADCEKPQPTCYYCKQIGHNSGDCPNVQCYRCGNNGHLARDCEQSLPSNQAPQSHYNSSRQYVDYQPQSRPSARSVVLSAQCMFCGSSTHDLRDCPEKEGSERKRRPTEEAERPHKRNNDTRSGFRNSFDSYRRSAQSHNDNNRSSYSGGYGNHYNEDRLPQQKGRRVQMQPK